MIRFPGYRFAITLSWLQPRLKCLLHLVDHLAPEGASFITAIVPEVGLRSKSRGQSPSDEYVLHHHTQCR